MTLYSNVFMSWRWKSVLAAKCSGELESSQYMCVDTIEKPAFLTQWWIYIESKYITVFFGETLPFVEKGSIKEKWPYYVDPWLLFLENWPFTQSWKSVLDPNHLMEKFKGAFSGAFQILWKRNLSSKSMSQRILRANSLKDRETEQLRRSCFFQRRRQFMVWTLWGQ